MENNHTYDPSISQKKGAMQAIVVGFIAINVSGILRVVQERTGIVMGTEVEAALIGIISGFVAGLVRWFNNRRKHKNA